MAEGRIVERPALSDVETIEVPGVGTLEAFLTDGLRTLLSTVRARSMVEKTLRYPGHAQAMRGLRESGFFDTGPFGEGGVSPRAVTERLLSAHNKKLSGVYVIPDASFNFNEIDLKP